MSEGTKLPHSLEAEEHLISCCLLDDGAITIGRCLEAGISAESFYDAKHALIFGSILGLHQRSLPIDVGVLTEEMKSAKTLDLVGMGFLLAVTGKAPTSAQAGYFIGKVRERHLLRRIIRDALGTAERAKNFTGSIDEFVEEIRASSIKIDGKVAVPRSLFDFKVAKPGDRSILLGNRYLNRGDGAFLVSTSGMGKSSMSLQMALHWALGLEAFGIRPNGPLKSLVIQAEDSDGDIGEVAASLQARLKLTPQQMQEAGSRVIIHTEKTRKNFFPRLRALIAKHKPDLVWINPLQSFMQGDIKDSKDLGDFLRDGLGELNSENQFGYIIVHHTTKPPQEAKERNWNEVMYDMAGGAEIINWSRAILSLRAQPEEGKFDLILAKRGRRAGVTKQVEQGAGFRSEVVTKIKLRYSNETCNADGLTIPMIYWESDEDRQEKAPREKKTATLDFGEVKSAIPVGIEKALTWPQVKRQLMGKKKVSDAIIADSLLTWAKDGLVMADLKDPNAPRYYLRA